MAPISFARGVPAPELLPVAELADCARAAVEQDGPTVLNYGPVAGYAPLREWIAERHGVEPAQVLVTNGSLKGLSLVAGLLLEPGARARRGADIRPRAAHRRSPSAPSRCRCRWTTTGSTPTRSQLPAAFLYTIPTFQNPSGRTLSLERRHRLAELAAERRAARRRGRPVRARPLRAAIRCRRSTSSPAAKGSSTRSRSRRSSRPASASATSSRRRDMIARLEALAVQTYLSPSFLSQATVLEFLRRGLLEPNVERVVRVLRDRRDAMLETLEQEMPEGASWSRPEGGYFVWLDFPAGTDARRARRRRRRPASPSSRARTSSRPARGARAQLGLPTASSRPTTSASGVARLGGLLREPRAAPVAV